ncbi:armadillo-type protein [Lentinula edodes]|uniref:armadillo-type protein n=1 Tax=Lentinula edodes TaxID=5353 RepID=UPI001E8E4BB9|nr:armadillo-type protein [Lentinula edodes]KAH7867872.1 armadillo-type protein [Lentinula edodes]
MPQEGARTWALAAFFFQNLCTPDPQHIKTTVLHALEDESALVGNVAGEAISTIFGILDWPECLPKLVKILEMSDLNKQGAALNTFKNMCENHLQKLDVDISGNRPLDLMIPRFLSFTDHPSVEMCAHSIACLAYLVPADCHSLSIHVDSFINCLLKCFSDNDPAVCWHYMLNATKDKNVALEACEFFFIFAGNVEHALVTKRQRRTPFLRSLLSKIALALLDCMIYSEDELLWLDDDKDLNIPDTEPNREGPIGSDDAGFVETMAAEWSVRKCAASVLDVLAVRFKGELFNVLLEPLKEKLWCNDWLQQESAILAVGATAEGCHEVMELHLPNLIPYLIDSLNDSKPLVRSITCWTLGRLSSWITKPISDELNGSYLSPTLEQLLCVVLDDNKQVQIAGCSAFKTLAENAGMELTPYLDRVLRNLVAALNKYSQKNMPMLYDSIGVLADAVGHELSNTGYVEVLLPPLIDHCMRLGDTDINLRALFQCLICVTTTLGDAFLPYASLVVERCYLILHKLFLRYQRSQEKPNVEESDQLILVLANIGMALEVLIKHSPNLLTLVTACFKHHHAPVVQSAYTFVGNMAMSCFDILRPFMPDIMSELVLQLTPEPKINFVGASNNALWSIGEVLLQYGQNNAEFQQWVNPLISRLILILRYLNSPQSIDENAAILQVRNDMRIGLMHPSIVAPHLSEFSEAWCHALCQSQEGEEKDSAFRGLCAMVQVNPAGIENSLIPFCDSMIKWQQPSRELSDMFRAVLHDLKKHDAVSWSVAFSAFSPITQEELATRYGA